MRGVRFWSALALVVAATGCAQAPKKQAFNREGSTHIKSVVVTQAPNQDSYAAAILGHPGQSFGLIGALVAAADQQTKTNRLTAALDPAETRLQERFSARLSDGLAQAGYSAAVLVVPKDTNEEQLLPLAQKQAAGDAVIAVELSGGYWAAGAETDYFPRVVAKVRALERASGKLLYEDTISYGYAMPRAQTVHLASDPQFRFRTIGALTEEPARAREGLYRGIEAIAAQVVDDLRKN
jgi:hypothetical protein